jgi:hypothetical protein
MTMRLSRRSFLGAAGTGLAGAALSPLVRVRRARAAGDYATQRVVIVAIAGGVRLGESLGMAEGATMPNLLGDLPLVPGFGASPAGAPRIAPEYAAAVRPLALPPPLARPLREQGAMITNLRYAEGAPGHLQGHACLVSGYYNNLENRSDARLPVPTVFELHRRATNAAATDAWYLSVPGGFYRALQSSDHPDFGPSFGGSYLSPPGVMSPLVPLVTSGTREVAVTTPLDLPAIPYDAAEDDAVRRLAAILDGNSPRFAADGSTFRASPQENADFQAHVARFYSDTTYGEYYPDSVGIGLAADGGGIDDTADALTIYHTEQILEKFRPAVTVVSLLDIDTCHADFNGYLRAQQLADASIRHLWEFIQSTDGLRDETALIVLPEHGRHLFHNGQNPDSLGRSGIDHGQGDDGDRDVWMLALGPDFAPGTVVAPTGVTQTGRTSGRYETIDVVRTAMELLGHGDAMATELEAAGARAGMVIGEVLA